MKWIYISRSDSIFSHQLSCYNLNIICKNLINIVKKAIYVDFNGEDLSLSARDIHFSCSVIIVWLHTDLDQVKFYVGRKAGAHI